MPKMQVPEKLGKFINTPKRFKIAIGGRGSGKSMTFADLCLMDAMTKNVKTACFREFQNSIDDSVHALLKSEIERLSLQGFEVQNNQILLMMTQCLNSGGWLEILKGLSRCTAFDGSGSRKHRQ